MNRDGQTPVFDMDNYEKMSKIKAKIDERKRSANQVPLALTASNNFVTSPPTFQHSPQEFNRDMVKSLTNSLGQKMESDQ